MRPTNPSRSVLTIDGVAEGSSSLQAIDDLACVCVHVSKDKSMAHAMVAGGVH